MITVEPAHVAVFFLSLGVLIIGILIGGFVEWNKDNGSLDLAKRLRTSQREVEELREFIWLVTAPSGSRATTAGALPTSSITVERSRHLQPVQGEASE